MNNYPVFNKEYCGQPISAEESQKIQLNMLDALAEYCDTHDLHYFLSGGTLLGAVRHKGFIPWDDDIDTCMAREDIDRLKEILKNNEEYCLTVKYDAWGYCKQIRFGYKNSELPVFIDVFPFDWACLASRESCFQYISVQLRS